MNRSLMPVLLAAVFLGCAHSQAKPTVELRLKLAKERIVWGDFLWYRLELKNAGRSPFQIDDRFWCHQVYQRDLQPQTYFRIFDSSGTERLPYFTTPLHSPFKPLSNDLNNHPCASHRLPLWVEPGKSLSPTPTNSQGFSSAPSGYRVLEGYELPPGFYTIEAVFAPKSDPKPAEHISPPVAFEVIP